MIPDPPSTWNIRSCVPLAGTRTEATTYWPSGVHVGEMTAFCDSFESFFGSLPSIFAIHRLSLPLRSLTNAMRVPSGETRGCASYASPSVMRVAVPPAMGSL